jgi:hypothetical protein
MKPTVGRRAREGAAFEELNYRDGGGIEVSLLWSRADDSLAVVVVDVQRQELFELPVAPAEAADAFRHPYAYAAARGVAALPITLAS